MLHVDISFALVLVVVLLVPTFELVTLVEVDEFTEFETLVELLVEVAVPAEASVAPSAQSASANKAAVDFMA